LIGKIGSKWAVANYGQGARDDTGPAAVYAHACARRVTREMHLGANLSFKTVPGGQKKRLSARIRAGGARAGAGHAIAHD
jgi:hypothetical protein